MARITITIPPVVINDFDTTGCVDIEDVKDNAIDYLYDVPGSLLEKAEVTVEDFTPEEEEEAE